MSNFLRNLVQRAQGGAAPAVSARAAPPLSIPTVIPVMPVLPTAQVGGVPTSASSSKAGSSLPLGDVAVPLGETPVTPIVEPAPLSQEPSAVDINPPPAPPTFEPSTRPPPEIIRERTVTLVSPMPLDEENEETPEVVIPRDLQPPETTLMPTLGGERVIEQTHTVVIRDEAVREGDGTGDQRSPAQPTVSVTPRETPAPSIRTVEPSEALPTPPPLVRTLEPAETPPPSAAREMPPAIRVEPTLPASPSQAARETPIPPVRMVEPMQPSAHEIPAPSMRTVEPAEAPPSKAVRETTSPPVVSVEPMLPTPTRSAREIPASSMRTVEPAEAPPSKAVRETISPPDMSIEPLPPTPTRSTREIPAPSMRTVEPAEAPPSKAVRETISPPDVSIEPPQPTPSPRAIRTPSVITVEPAETPAAPTPRPQKRQFEVRIGSLEVRLDAPTPPDSHAPPTSAPAKRGFDEYATRRSYRDDDL